MPQRSDNSPLLKVLLARRTDRRCRCLDSSGAEDPRGLLGCDGSGGHGVVGRATRVGVGGLLRRVCRLHYCKQVPIVVARYIRVSLKYSTSFMVTRYNLNGMARSKGSGVSARVRGRTHTHWRAHWRAHKSEPLRRLQFEL
jgi:hypothetical protein